MDQQLKGCGDEIEMDVADSVVPLGGEDEKALESARVEKAGSWRRLGKWPRPKAKISQEMTRSRRFSIRPETRARIRDSADEFRCECVRTFQYCMSRFHFYPAEGNC
ncbi:hypothetical protein MKEN_01122100 [Mycena kentingensis (nom. inval.)]|nr:hypothetical protein MKEN_01122100 [Mycena kentingensis (nom. inval.)]